MGDQEARPEIASSTRKVDLRIAPRLLTDRLGAELYSPAEALQQIVANALDAGCSRVEINITENVLGAAIEAVVADDGIGITPDEIEASFAVLGEHKTLRPPRRDIIGSKV